MLLSTKKALRLLISVCVRSISHQKNIDIEQIINAWTVVASFLSPLATVFDHSTYVRNSWFNVILCLCFIYLGGARPLHQEAHQEVNRDIGFYVEYDKVYMISGTAVLINLSCICSVLMIYQIIVVKCLISGGNKVLWHFVAIYSWIKPDQASYVLHFKQVN